MTKSTGIVLTVLLLAAVGGGAALMLSNKSSDSKPKDPRLVKVFTDGVGETDGTWFFTISQDGAILHGPTGPFANQEAAKLAGENWLAENPMV